MRKTLCASSMVTIGEGARFALGGARPFPLQHGRCMVRLLCFHSRLLLTIIVVSTLPPDSSRRSRSPRGRHSRSRSRSSERSLSPRRSGADAHGRALSPRYREASPVLGDEIVTDSFIRAVAAEVKGHGAEYEANLKEREKNNTKYGFMTNRGVCCNSCKRCQLG